MRWDVLDTGIASAACNMALDYDLLQNLSSTSNPLLHLYDWEQDSATFGYFLTPEHFLRPDATNKLQLARRPTGGGLLLHTTDLAFSILIPAHHPKFSLNTMDNYAYINTLVADAIQKFSGQKTSLLSTDPSPQSPICQHFCMAKPTQHDVMIGERKVAGGAQRRTKNGFLHQGTISLACPSLDFLHDIFRPETDIFVAMQKNTYPLAEGLEAKRELREAIINRLKKEEEHYGVH